MSDAPEALGEFDDKLQALYDALHLFLTPDQRVSWSMLVPPLEDLEEPEGERLVPRRESSSQAWSAITPRGFTDACEDVERLGHLLRSIVLLSRNRDFVEDYRCIEQVADIAEETWKRIKPLLPGALATA